MAVDLREVVDAANLVIATLSAEAALYATCVEGGLFVHLRIEILGLGLEPCVLLDPTRRARLKRDLLLLRRLRSFLRWIGSRVWE